MLTEEMRSKSGDYIDIDKDRMPCHRQAPLEAEIKANTVNPYPIPQFSFFSTKLHANIRVPLPGSWISDMEGSTALGLF
ncbi:hypothetical protein M405DRAFT_936012 [Rhizopogon salebrosus TDB-379]|nr:hypothetical protein M405DRAFT_936012 [Rhizopogon salebrosus TDB-379]